MFRPIVTVGLLGVALSACFALPSRAWADAPGSQTAILVAPYAAPGREASIVQFPGGYIAEIHSAGK